MHYHKFSLFTKIIFLSFTYYVISNSIIFPYFINTFGRDAWYVPLLILPVAIIILLFINTDRLYNLKKKIINTKFLRFIIVVYLIIMSLFLIYSSTLSIKFFFFNLTPNYMFYIMFIFIACYFSYFGINTIINLSTILFIFIPILLLFPFILPNNEFNNSLILPISINKDIYKSLIILLIPLDMSLLYIFENHSKKKISKLEVIIPTIIIFVTLSINLFTTISTFSFSFLQNLSFSGYFFYDSVKISHNFDNYEIILLYVISITTFFKISLNFHLIRILLKLKRKKSTYITIFLIFISLLIVYQKNAIIISDVYNIFYLVLFCLISIYFIYITTLLRRPKNDEIKKSN